MTQCEMCQEVGESDCEHCYLGNPYNNIYKWWTVKKRKE